MRIMLSDPELTEKVGHWYETSFKRGRPSQSDLEGLIEAKVLPLRALTPSSSEGLSRVEVSSHPYAESPFVPAQVRRLGGSIEDAVLFVSDLVYFYLWDTDRAKTFLPADEVLEVRTSPFQLPPRIARKVYGFDETGMGYVTFELLMLDGKRIPCRFSSVAEFIRLPDPYRVDQIADAVNPHGQPSRADLLDPEFLWCVYRADASVIRRLAPRLANVDLDANAYLAMRPEVDTEGGGSCD